MKLLNLIIQTLFIVMIATFIFFDVMHIIWTPLTMFGMNHWIPELGLIFSIGYAITEMKSIDKIETEVIIIILFLYPLLYALVIEQTIFSVIFGFGSGCLFSGVFLAGVWKGRVKNG